MKLETSAMHFHILQHVDFEGPAAIEHWITDKHHSFTITRFYLAEHLPAQDDFDVLIIMGGPMGVEDAEQYPWLIEERRFIQQSIRSGKTILGICLGAQLIARAAGATVVKNTHREIGWFPVSLLTEGSPAVLKGVFESGAEAFHWHGDTFGIPPAAVNFASSTACAHQAFILCERVIALQFHIETTESSAALLVTKCRDELDGSKYVQSEEEIFSDPVRFNAINKMLYRLLENMAALSQPDPMER